MQRLRSGAGLTFALCAVGSQAKIGDEVGSEGRAAQQEGSPFARSRLTLDTVSDSLRCASIVTGVPRNPDTPAASWTKRPMPASSSFTTVVVLKAESQ